MKVPKSLYQSPSGTSGLDSIQSRSWLRSAMLAYRDGQIVPSFDLGHQPPNTMRPSSSPNRFASSGFVAPRKRSANSKNCCCFLLCASIPSSISSRSIRFALSRRAFASKRTWAATPAGRLILWRIVLFAILITPLCTKLVHQEWRERPRSGISLADIVGLPSQAKAFFDGSQKSVTRFEKIPSPPKSSI